jgi:uncharacterized protein
MSYEKPLPVPDADSRPFWEGCKHHRLSFQRCLECGRLRSLPAIICPHCHSRDMEWFVSNGRGKIYTYAIYHQAFQPAFKGDLPYVVAVVELDEGPFMLTNITGCNHDLLKCEMRVGVVWEDITEEFSLPKFKPILGSEKE